MFLVENGYLPSAGVTQLVECDLAKVDVAGSNPVSRSKTAFIYSLKPHNRVPRADSFVPHLDGWDFSNTMKNWV